MVRLNPLISLGMPPPSILFDYINGSKQTTTRLDRYARLRKEHGRLRSPHGRLEASGRPARERPVALGYHYIEYLRLH